MKHISNIIKNAFACGVRRYGRALLLVTALMAISSSAWADKTLHLLVGTSDDYTNWTDISTATGTNEFTFNMGSRASGTNYYFALSTSSSYTNIYPNTSASDGDLIDGDSGSLLSQKQGRNRDSYYFYLVAFQKAGNITITYNEGTKKYTLTTGSAPVGECTFYIAHAGTNWSRKEDPMIPNGDGSYSLVDRFTGDATSGFDVYGSDKSSKQYYELSNLYDLKNTDCVFTFTPAQGCDIKGGKASIVRNKPGTTSVYFHDEDREYNPGGGLSGRQVFLKYHTDDVYITEELHEVDFGWYKADNIPLAANYIIYTSKGDEVEHETSIRNPQFDSNKGVSVGYYDIACREGDCGNTYNPNTFKFLLKKEGESNWNEHQLQGFSQNPQKLAYYAEVEDLPAGTYYFYAHWNNNKNCIVENNRGSGEIETASFTAQDGNSVNGGKFILTVESKVTLYMDPSQQGSTRGNNGMFVDINPNVDYNTQPKVYVGTAPVRLDDKTVKAEAFIPIHGCKVDGSGQSLGVASIKEITMYYAKDKKANTDDANIVIIENISDNQEFIIPDGAFLQSFKEEGHTIHVRFQVINESDYKSDLSDDVAIPYMYCENSIKAFNITPVTGRLVKGESMSFSTSILGGGVATYKWYVKQDDGEYQEQSGATESTFTYSVPDNYSATKTYIKAVATGEFCSDEAEAVAEMGLCPTPTFTVDPVSATTPWATVTLTSHPVNVAKVEWSVDNPDGILKDASINGVTFKGGKEGTYRINAVATGTECGSVTAETNVTITVNPETPDDCK